MYGYKKNKTLVILVAINFISVFYRDSKRLIKVFELKWSVEIVKSKISTKSEQGCC